jgi:hypothetical protein
MNLTLLEIIDKIRFDPRPKNSRAYVNMFGTKLPLISKIAAEIENRIVIII